MNCLFFMFMVSTGLLVCRLSWTAYKYAVDNTEDLPVQCDCFCEDSTMTMHDLHASVHYNGAKFGASCSCHDFLLPKMRKYLFSVNANVTCEICKCEFAKDSDCVDGQVVSFISAFDIMTATILAVTFVFLLSTAIEGMHRSRYSFIRRHRQAAEYQEKRISRACRLLEEFFKGNDLTKSDGDTVKNHSENANILCVEVPKCVKTEDPKVHKTYKTFRA